MKLKALDQIHISSVKADALRPQEEFTVTKATGAELMKAHPNTFEVVDDADEEAPAEAAEKAAEAPANKAAPAHADKAAPKPKGKAKA